MKISKKKKGYCVQHCIVTQWRFLEKKKKTIFLIKNKCYPV